MGNPAFVPIDANAKTGAFYLVRDRRGHQHCAHWDGEMFVYRGGTPVAGVVTEYASRGAK